MGGRAGRDEEAVFVGGWGGRGAWGHGKERVRIQAEQDSMQTLCPSAFGMSQTMPIEALFTGEDKRGPLQMFLGRHEQMMKKIKIKIVEKKMQIMNDT